MDNSISYSISETEFPPAPIFYRPTNQQAEKTELTTPCPDAVEHTGGLLFTKEANMPTQSPQSDSALVVSAQLNGKLNPEEQSAFEKAEKIIENGLRSCFDVGRELKVIRDGRLYREMFRTFEDYLQMKWDISRSYAYQLVDSYSVLENLSEVSEILPENEYQVRQLAPLAPDQQREVWLKAVANKGTGHITGKAIKSLVSAFLAANAEPDDAYHEHAAGIISPCAELLQQYQPGDYMAYSSKFEEKSISLVLIAELPGNNAAEQSDWLTDLFKETDSAIADNANVFVFAENVDFRYIIDTVEGRGFDFVGSAAWVHGGRRAKFEVSFVRARTEILHFRRGQAKLYTPIDDCMECNYEPLKKHHQQIPLALIKLLVGAATKPGDLAFDPICRVATTYIACHELGRGCICVDPEDETYQLGVQRLKEEPVNVIDNIEGGVA